MYVVKGNDGTKEELIKVKTQKLLTSPVVWLLGLLFFIGSGSANETRIRKSLKLDPSVSELYFLV